MLCLHLSLDSKDAFHVLQELVDTHGSTHRVDYEGPIGSDPCRQLLAVEQDTAGLLDE